MTPDTPEPTPLLASQVTKALGPTAAGVFPTPHSLGRYPIHASLGEGGMGRVYLVRDGELGRLVAAKVLRFEGDESARRRFVLEARITGGLEHPNIVPLYELGIDDGRPYFTMRRVHGGTLHDLILGEAMQVSSRRYAIRTRMQRRIELLTIYMKVCDAVAYAHHQRVIHRDLKPENVMVGEFGEVLVMDWGLAKQLDQVDHEAGQRIDSEHWSRVRPGAMLTMDGSVVGTPAYMPPEQARGNVHGLDERSDIYSLGAILYFVLTGAPPYDGDGDEVIRLVQADELVPPSRRAGDVAVPRELEALILKAMAHDPAERYANVLQLRSDVEAYLAGRPVEAANYTRVQRLKKWIGRHRALVSASAVAALVVIGTSIVAMVRITAALRDERQARLREVQQRTVADQQRAEAERQRNEVVLLADHVLLDQLRVQLGGLWIDAPSDRDVEVLVQKLDRWIAQAHDLLGRAAAHRASLQALRLRGRQDGEHWEFQSHVDTWRHGLLTELVASLDAWEAGRDSLLHAAIERRQRYRALEASLASDSELWRRAMSVIADVALNPHYRGLAITPQLGLRPLGPDPISTLWEFALDLSGGRPVRGPDGQLSDLGVAAIVLVLVPGGRFAMGARREGPATGPNIDPEADDDELPVHEVSLLPFFLGKHELTRHQRRGLESWAGTRPSPVPVANPRHPVTDIAWDEAVALLHPTGLVLPTEAQWEYAARGGTRTIWWTGDQVESLLAAESIGRPILEPVGSRQASPFGFYDIQGNVREWCRDPWGSYGQLPEEGEGLRNANQDGRLRCVRGGCWRYDAASSRSANRSREPAAQRFSYVGIRPSRPLVR